MISRSALREAFMSRIAISRIAALLFLALGLAGCDAVSTLTDGFKYKAAVEDDLQKATGIKPQVGFNWSNGRLALVTVLFPKVVDAKPLGELAETVRLAVTSEFKQRPDTIELAFVIGSGSSPAAQLREPPAKASIEASTLAQETAL
jgi:hypothetical protein